jgi:proline racemase
MNRPLVVQAMDYHTAGEPFRIVTGGVGPIPGATMLEKRRYAMTALDPIRRLLVYEPRGHADMYGCFVTDPVSPDGDLGVLFFHNAGYSTACGHGTIALVTAALETGMVATANLPAPPADYRMVIDAPSGRLETIARFASPHRVSSVRFRNIPSFVETPCLPVELPDLGQIDVAISYGGAFYALVDVLRLGLRIEPAALPALIAYGRAIKQAVEEAHFPLHPLEPDLRGIYGVIFAETREQRSQSHPRRDVNVTIFADGEVDRSPCGSGTSARLALLHATGALSLGETLIHESIIGSRFTGCVVEQTMEAGRKAVITEVEGSAWLTGYHTFVLESDDPLATGFLLR